MRTPEEIYEEFNTLLVKTKPKPWFLAAIRAAQAEAVETAADDATDIASTYASGQQAFALRDFADHLRAKAKELREGSGA